MAAENPTIPLLVLYSQLMQHTKCTSLILVFNWMRVRPSLFVPMEGGQDTNLAVSLKIQNFRSTAK